MLSNRTFSESSKLNSTTKTPKCNELKRNVSDHHKATRYSHGVNNVNLAWLFSLAMSFTGHHRVVMYLESLERTKEARVALGCALRFSRLSCSPVCIIYQMTDGVPCSLRK